MQGNIKDSKIIDSEKIVQLPNPISTSTFKPNNLDSVLELWSLSGDKRYILYGAIDSTGDLNKGYNELLSALKFLRNDETIELVIFGSNRPVNELDLGFKTHYVGFLNDEISLVALYSLASVMVVPSIQESFGQTASEAMACATPVVAFNTSGLKDIVDHKVNGYLATSYDPQDLANGIHWVLNNEGYDDLCKNARNKILQSFDSNVVAKKYIETYNNILSYK